MIFLEKTAFLFQYIDIFFHTVRRNTNVQENKFQGLIFKTGFDCEAVRCRENADISARVCAMIYLQTVKPSAVDGIIIEDKELYRYYRAAYSTDESYEFYRLMKTPPFCRF